MSASAAQAQDGVWGFADPNYSPAGNCVANNAELISITPDPGSAQGSCTSINDTIQLPVDVTYSLNGNNVRDLLIAYGVGGSGTIAWDDCLAQPGASDTDGLTDIDGDTCLDGAGLVGTYTISRIIDVGCDLDNDGTIDSGTAVDLWAAWKSNNNGGELFDVTSPQCFGPTGGTVLSIAPKLTVAKTTVNGTGTFNFTVQGAQNSDPFSLTTTAENTPVLNPNDILPSRTGGGFNNMIITETVPDGWTASAVCTGLTAGVDYTDDGNGVLTINGSAFVDTIPQQVIECTFTNSRDTASLTLDKVVENGVGGTAVESDWTIFASTDGTLANAELSGAGAAGSVDVTGTLTTDTYIIGESPDNADYDLTTVCTGMTNSTFDPGTGELVLAADEDVTCTLTNSYNKSSLTLIKNVINDSGGTAAPGDFTLNYNGIAAAQGVAIEVDPGSFTLTETLVTGYAAGSPDISCVITGTNSSFTSPTLTLAAGEGAVCTFNNDDIAPTYDMAKTADVPAAGAGDTVTYTFAFTNNGDWPISNLTPVDTSFPGLSVIDCGAGATSIASLAAGATESCTATYLVTQDDVDGNGNGTVVPTGTCASGFALVNNATSTAEESAPDADPLTEPDLTNNSATVCLPVRDERYTITKVVDDLEIDAPAPLTYTVTVVNTGNVSLTGAVFTDALLQNGAAQAFTESDLNLSEGANSDGILEVGETWTYTGTYNATQANINDGNDLVNTASIAFDQLPTPQEDSATTTITQNEAYTITKVVDDLEIDAPAPLTYTVTVVNTGNVELTGAVFTDALLQNGAAQAFTESDLNLSEGANSDGILEVGETWTYTGTYNATQANINDGNDLVNTASIAFDQLPTPQEDSATTTITQNEAYTITKVVDDLEIDAPAPLTYTVTVVNTGNVELTGAVFTDALLQNGAAQAFTESDLNLSEGANSDGILEVGETWTYTGTYNATQANINDGNDLVNTASIAFDQLPIPQEDSATTTITQNEAYTITKVVDDLEIDAPAPLTYTVTVVNTGNVELTGAVFTDALLQNGAAQAFTESDLNLSEGANSDGILEVGETWTYTGTYNATQANINDGNDLVNTASIAFDQLPTPQEDSATTTITQNEAYTITKVVDDLEIDAPAPLTYTVTVVNTGNVELTGAVFTDALLQNGAAQAFTESDLNLSEGANSDGILEVGETWTYTGTYNATQANINDGNDLVNTASIAFDQLPTPQEDSATTTITQNEAYTITKVVDDLEIDAPAPLTYTVTVVNTGNVELTGAVFTDALLQNGAAQAFTESDLNLSEGANSDGILEVGETWTYTGTYNATQANINDGNDLVNTASIAFDQLPTPQEDSATTTITQNEAYTITKVVDDLEIDAPAPLTYTVTVVNTGNVELTGAVFTDALLQNGAAQAFTESDLNLSEGANSDGILEVGETWTYTGTYNATQANINDGNDLVNTASIAFDQLPIPQEDSATTTITQNEAYTITKVVDDLEIDAPAPLTYTVTVVNTGNVELTGAVFTDALLQNGAAQAFTESDLNLSEGANSDGILEVGETWTYTGTYNATQANINDGNDLVNTASIAFDQLPIPQEDSATTTITQNEAYTITKVVDDLEIDAPAPLTYTVTVVNTGNVELTGAVFTDALLQNGAAQAFTESDLNLSEGANSDGILEVGETWTYTGTYNATQANINDGNDLVNTASIAFDQLPTPQEDSATTTITQNEAYTITKVVDDLEIDAPAPLTYTVTVVNTGNVELTGAVFTDALLQNGAAQAFTESDLNLSEGANSDGILEVGETWTYTGTYNATQANINDGNDLVNTASIAFDQLPIPQEDSATTTITQNEAYTITKVVDDLEIDAPAPLTYTVTVVNTGNVELTGAVFTDALLQNGAAQAFTESDLNLSEGANSDGILEVGETWTYTGTYNATQANINDGNDLVNTASIAFDQLPIPQEDSATTTITQNEAYTITKVVDDLEIDAPAPLTYTVTVVNTGNVELTGAVFTDALLQNGAAQAFTESDLNLSEGANSDGILEVGETWTYTGTYNATQANINDGNDLVNTASIAFDQLPIPQEDSATTTITQNEAYTITKVVDDLEIDAPAPLTYTVTVVNTGNVELTGAVFTDALLQNGAAQAFTESDLNLSEGANSDGILEVGETWTYTGTYNATQANINDGNDLVNTASIAFDQLPIPQEDSATTTITQNEAYTITKVVDDLEIDAPAPLTYTVTVVNTGNVELTGAVFTDALLQNGAAQAFTESDLNLSEGANSDGILEVGETWTYTGTYNATQANINDGNDLVNTASIAFDQLPTPQEDSATTTITQNEAYTITKVVDDLEIDAPAPLTYTVTVVNTGNVELTGAVFTDALLQNGAAQAFTESDLNLSEGANSDGILEVGETWTYTGTYNATQANINDGNDLVNTASIAFDQLPTPQEDSATTTITQNEAYTITKVVDDLEIDAPAPLTYTVTVVNTGNVELTGAVFTDALLQNGAAQAFTESDLNLSEGANSDGILEVGETWTYTGTYNATQANINDGNDLVNTASIAFDQLPTPQEDSATTTITQNEAYTITKVVDDLEIDAPAPLTYTVTVVNTGNVELTGAVFTDALLQNGAAQAFTESDLNLSEGANSDGILEVGETWTYTGTYNATQANINDGNDLVNTASIAFDQLPTPQEDSATTTITQNEAYTITKVVDDLEIDAPAPLTYTVTVVNTGNVELTGAVFTDALLQNGAAQAFTESDLNLSEGANSDGILEVGETWTYTGTYNATQANINDGNDLVNTASIAFDELPEPQSDSATTTIAQNPAFTIEKVADKDSVGPEAESIDYTITVVNTGNVTLTEVSLVDETTQANLDETQTFPIPLASGPTLVSGDANNDGNLDVGETWVYEASVDVTDSMLQITDSFSPGRITNVATFDALQVDPDSSEAVTDVEPQFVNPAEAIDLVISKTAPREYVLQGDVVPWVIEVTNNGVVDTQTVNVIDRLPAGFLYQDGSATINGAVATVTVNDGVVAFPPVDVAPGATVVLQLSTFVSSSVQPGIHTNYADLIDPDGNVETASASVVLSAEPVFDCGTVIGKVFDDVNQNGYQDEAREPGIPVGLVANDDIYLGGKGGKGKLAPPARVEPQGEPGIPGVRIYTVKGEVYTTDEHGRFHVACADLPRDIGSNFTMKIDTRSLPAGYRLTTENPRAVRLTPGKTTKLNFGATISRLVRIDVANNAFIPGSNDPKPEFTAALARAVMKFSNQPSTVRISYLLKGEDNRTARVRMRKVEAELRQIWRKEGKFRLMVEKTLQRPKG
ncbi:DUF7507 domain-containing protein [Roseovarius faecimaris]|nr:DUF11 domain-containing protein [Roseovarius faecimaris]